MGLVYAIANDFTSENSRLQKDYNICQQMINNAPNRQAKEYVRQHTYPPKSEYTCRQIEKLLGE